MPFRGGCDRFHIGLENTAFRVKRFTGRTPVRVDCFTPEKTPFRAL